MSESAPEEAQQSGTTSPPRPRRSLMGSIRSVGTVFTALILIVIVVGLVLFHVYFDKLENESGVLDRSIRTILTVAGVLLGITVLSGWVIFLSGLHVKARLAMGLFGFLLFIGVCAAVEPYSNSGDLASWKLKWRWEKMPDEKLAALEVVERDEESQQIDFGDVDANAALDGRVGGGPRRNSSDEPVNFPQYLGPDRRGYLQGPLLDIDWDANKPKELWKQEIGAGWSAFSAANGYAVTMEQRGANELVTCYDIDTGEVMWFHEEETRLESPLGGVGPRSTPTIHEGKVYTVGATGILLCLNDHDGSEVWRKDIFGLLGTTQEEQANLVTWGRAGSPLIYNDMVVVPGGGKDADSCVSLFAFDKETGEERWRAGDEQISYSSPIVVGLYGDDQIVVMNESSLSGYSPTDGEELWSYPRSGDSAGPANTAQPVNLGGQSFLLTKGYGSGAEVIQLSRTGEGYKATQLWTDARLMKTKFTSSVELEGYVYGLSDGILECVRGRTGDRQWKQGRYGHGQVLLVGRQLLVISEKGYVSLVAATPEKFIQWTKFEPLQGVTWNTICLYGNKLLVRNSEMAGCWELPLLQSTDEPEEDEDEGVPNAQPSFQTN